MWCEMSEPVNFCCHCKHCDYDYETRPAGVIYRCSAASVEKEDPSFVSVKFVTSYKCAEARAQFANVSMFEWVPSCPRYTPNKAKETK